MTTSATTVALGAQGATVKGLHDNLAKAGLMVPAAEVTQSTFGTGTRDAALQLQTQFKLAPTGDMDAISTAVLAGAAAAASNGLSIVSGRVAMDYGAPAAGATLRLYSIGFGGTATVLAETKTDANGVYTLTYKPQANAPNLEVRAVGDAGKEVAISQTRFGAEARETFNLVAPASLQPLAPEYRRLSADMERQIGGVAKLGQAQESADRRDISIISRASNWDGRLIALAAHAAQQSTTTGLGSDVLYALFRVGLPTDPQRLALVSSDTISQTLTKASQSGIVSMNADQVKAAATSFQNFATRTRLAMTAPGAVSSFQDLLKNVVPDATQQAAFANLFFNANAAAEDLWTKAADLKIPAQTITILQLQGKLLYLTFNNAALAQDLQKQIGSADKLSALVDAGLHDSAAWKARLNQIAGIGGQDALSKLIPTAYTQSAVADRLEAYAGDLARQVRLSFPTQVVARMLDQQELKLDANAGKVSSFLRAAAPLGFELGRTPLNAFLKSQTAGLPKLDAQSTQSLKDLHRIYQLTPSTESMQAALQLGFKSAHQIASYTKDEFMSGYALKFPSAAEASLVYGKSQQVSSVTFNFYAMAKQLDNAPPVYGMSASSGDREAAKNAIVKQFPTMESLFGNLDFCQCEECRSVLSPAAYFVDLLEFLRQSAANDKGYVPLDVLIGKDNVVRGRRPDLAALRLTCENTNTALPYIDLVNEILEYYVANNHLDADAAYDTGDATTDDLTAEPQHILSPVYTNVLNKAVYPVGLPFDLWIETVRGFLNYFKTPLAQVLEALRPADQLELFTDPNSYPYYRAQIFAELLGLSPSEYSVLTVTDLTTNAPSVQNWFQLYGYANENTALNGQVDPTDASKYLIAPLKSAKNLSERLGITYQQLVDMVESGFLNPALDKLTFQFSRFEISIQDAFAYTGQPGYTALAGQKKTEFETLLASVTQKYQASNPEFDAKQWLQNLLTTKYSQGVWVLNDPDTGCDFINTTLQYADGSALNPFDFLKLNLFARLWKKLGWRIEEVDRALQLFFPATLPAWTNPGFAAACSNAWKTALVNLAHLDAINSQLRPALGRIVLLPLWSNLPVDGKNPLYARLFLTPSVLNNDVSYDDPTGAFPSTTTDFLSTHLSALLGVLGLTTDEATNILTDAGNATATVTKVVSGQNVTAPTFTLGNISICYRYSLLAKCLNIPVANLIALKALSGLDPLRPPGGTAFTVLSDDALYTRTLAFLKQVQTVQSSGFDVAALRYLLRHQFDPTGPYEQDPNAQMALVQSVAIGLRLIAAQNALPPDLNAVPNDVLQQKLAALFPAQVLQTFTAILSGGQSYVASQGGIAPASQLDPTAFAHVPEINLAYDPTTQTQTLTYHGVLLDWKKTQLLQINNSVLFSTLLGDIQQQGVEAFTATMADVLGVWSSLVEYEAVKTAVATAVNSGPLTAAIPGLRLSYDQADQLQWLGYRGVLTDEKKTALQAIDPSPTLAALLNDVQGQAMPAYRQLLGTVVATFAQAQTYVSVATAVPAANKIDGSVFAAHPEMQFSYDATAQTQTLTFQGILTDANRGAFAALLPASTVLPGLLQDVRNQALKVFQTEAAHLLTVAAADLDIFAQGVIDVDAAGRQKRANAALVQIFQPLLTRKLARKFVVETISSALGADPTFTEDLLTEAALLNDPNNPGKSLLPTFLSLGTQGVSATYYGSADSSGPALASGSAATVDLGDATNPNAGKAGTGSAHFEGYIQVPTDGPYRFFAELGNLNAHATFRLDSPNPAALLANPIIDAKAAKDADEASQFVVLQGGTPYHFTVDFTALGAAGASLLIQSEMLPKGALNRVVLLPGTAVTRVARSQTLIAKTMQILETFDINERELAYLSANGAKFGNLRLSALPTQASDDTAAGAVALFAQFLALADYAALRKGPFGGADGLISVFENVGATYTEVIGSASTNTDATTPWTRLGNLTRRDPQIVRDVAIAFGLIKQTTAGANYQITALADFASSHGIRRIWDALQIVQVVGIPVKSLITSTLIVSRAPPAGSPAPDALAATLKNAVKARYNIDAWRPVAKSVFNKLRQKKRDALVAFLVNTLALENSDQLFEYFLIDPGMEPVVQTSRIRLALSSVQTFIQRCLLNLENGAGPHPERNVMPSAIDADWWLWMKRYRVWEANREIFLYPENWMEPELRLDKTDLFQALESALTQGDITRDLAESAFLDYLKGLDVRARLDVVATYLDQDMTHPGLSTLHVLAMTYGKPHKYFYRTDSNATWSAWIAVQPDIESDHIALTMWRGKLNLFWLTFVRKSQGAPAPTGSDSTAVANLSFTSLADKIYAASAQEQLQVQLNWCEYYQGKWSERIATDINKTEIINVQTDFDINSIHIHVSKEADESSIKIHLDFPIEYEVAYIFTLILVVLAGGDPNTVRRANHAFRITSKNGDPAFSGGLWEAAPPMPYTSTGVDATVYTGSSLLQSSFQSGITSTTSQTETENILQTVNNFSLATCANAVAPPFLDPSEPDYQEAGALVSPFFYKDTTHPGTRNELTFFVQPSLTETTIIEWIGWAVPVVVGTTNFAPWIDLVKVIAQVPPTPIPISPGDPMYSVFPVKSQVDWVTNPATAISFGGAWIGQQGGLNPGVLAASGNASRVIAGAATGATVGAMPAGSIIGAATGRVMVGSDGLSASHLQTLDAVQKASTAKLGLQSSVLALRQLAH